MIGHPCQVFLDSLSRILPKACLPQIRSMRVAMLSAWTSFGCVSLLLFSPGDYNVPPPTFPGLCSDDRYTGYFDTCLLLQQPETQAFDNARSVRLQRARWALRPAKKPSSLQSALGDLVFRYGKRFGSVMGRQRAPEPSISGTTPAELELLRLSPHAAPGETTRRGVPCGV